jgi:hypothetical protein
LLDLIQLLLQPLGTFVLLKIRALKISTAPATAFGKGKRSRREINKKAGDKKANGQGEEKRQNSL